MTAKILGKRRFIYPLASFGLLGLLLFSASSGAKALELLATGPQAGLKAKNKMSEDEKFVSDRIAEKSETYRSLRELKARGSSGSASVLREGAQKEAALGAAIQSGTKARYQKITKEVLDSHREVLNELFDFEPLVIRRGPLLMLPPVITSAGNALRVLSDESVSSQSKSFKMIRPARIVTVVPNWRTYLEMTFETQDDIHPSVLPASLVEAGRWREWVDQGWLIGQAQADSLFENNLARLVRDYAGMLVYLRLYNQKLVESPEVSIKENGLEIRDREIVFDKTLYQMEKDGKFIDKSQRTKGKQLQKGAK